MTTPAGPIQITIVEAESPTVAITRTPPPGVSVSSSGPQGAPGTRIYETSGTPSNSLGLAGDYAIDTDTAIFYGPKGASIWPVDTLSLKGPQGDQGTPTTVNGKTGSSITLNSTDTGSLAIASNLSDLNNAGTARTNLGLGNSATRAVGTTTGTVAAGDDSRITGAAQKASNLSDLASASTARTNLGLGGAAILNVGTATSTVAAGDDSRITGAAQKASNLSDLASVSTARTNLGLGGSAVLNVGTAASTVAAGNDSRITGAAQKASNLSDLASVSTARTNLGLGGAATLNVGTATGTVAAGDDSRITGAAQSNTAASFSSLDVSGQALGLLSPRARGLIGWSTDPTNVQAGTTMTLGTVYLVGIYVNRSVNATTIYWGFTTTAVSSPTAGQCFVGLYNSSGTRLATAAVESVAGTTGLNATTISSTALTPGLYWVGLVFNGSSAGTHYRAGSLTSSVLNIGVSAAGYQFATNGTSQTSLPATITPSSNTGGATAFFVAIG
ncbi:hypothetical protein SEA_MOAB_31 [Streptomyces phage Moab]|nr:hypothetical protein SEA_MOAB_31 [Streptomyces phage Moab]